MRRERERSVTDGGQREMFDLALMRYELNIALEPVRTACVPDQHYIKSTLSRQSQTVEMSSKRSASTRVGRAPDVKGRPEVSRKAVGLRGVPPEVAQSPHGGGPQRVVPGISPM